MASTPAPGNHLALVTGASSGIGFELARCFAEDGHRLVVVSADRDRLDRAAARLREAGSPEVEAFACDLSRPDAARQVWVHMARDEHRLPDHLVLNAGVGLVGDFIATPLDDELAMIELNAVNPLKLAKLFLPRMVARGSGRLLFTSSVTALAPSPRQAVYSATKAFDFAFAECLANELKGTGVSCTALLPDATETGFFARAGALDTNIGRAGKADAGSVARAGYQAMMRGDDHVVAPFTSRIKAALTGILPERILTAQARVE